MDQSGFPMRRPCTRYAAWREAAPDAEAFLVLMDKTAALGRRPYDWRGEIGKLEVRTMLVYADADGIPPEHRAASLRSSVEDLGIRAGTAREVPAIAWPFCPAARMTTGSSQDSSRSWSTTLPSRKACPSLTGAGRHPSHDAAQLRASVVPVDRTDRIADRVL